MRMDRERILKDIEEIGGKAYSGRTQLIAHLENKRLTQRQAIQAFCYECQGYCADGRPECGREICPLHPFSPFNPHREKRGARTKKKILVDAL
jgi:rRNA maturation protein Nop10